MTKKNIPGFKNRQNLQDQITVLDTWEKYSLPI